MEQPTKEQIRTFWEWCGFKIVESYPSRNWEYVDIKYSDGHEKLVCYQEKTLPFDLDNIFQYAIPKLQSKGYQIDINCFEHKGFGVWIYDVIHNLHDNQVSHCESDDLVLALFGAIWEVIK